MQNFLQHNIRFDEYITGNKFIDICEETGATFCKTDYINYFSSTHHKVFVTHNSDYHIDDTRYSIIPKFDAWFAQNKDVDDPRIVSVPIGLENMKLRQGPSAHRGAFSSEVKGAHQKALLIDRISSLGLNKTGLCYMNFNVSTYPSERQQVWSCFSDKDWVTPTSNLSLEKFYFDLASHKFVISPRGNGVDCHRTWEALYLRTIPIVRRSRHTKEFEDLPIFFVDKWSEVDYNSLIDFYEHVQNTNYNLDKMKISYWKKRINEKLYI